LRQLRHKNEIIGNNRIKETKASLFASTLLKPPKPILNQSFGKELANFKDDS